MTKIQAKCTVCGHRIIVEEPEQGQSLYGTMAGEMGSHENRCAISDPRDWWWNHGGPDTSVEGVYSEVNQ